MKINRTLNEASTTRLIKKLTDDSESFAIISGERPESDRTAELKQDVLQLKFGFNEFIGRWVEDGISYDEKSLLISGISFDDAMSLGSKYNQASIIYKDANGINEYCTTAFTDDNKEYDKGDIVRKYAVDKNKPLNIKLAADIFSRNISGPASVLKNGSNKHPFNFKTVEEDFELYEKIFLNSRLGFSNTRVV